MYNPIAAELFCTMYHRHAYGEERRGGRREELSRGSFGKENKTPADYVQDVRHRLSEDRDEELRQYRGGRGENAREMRYDHPRDSYHQYRDSHRHNERKGGSWAEDERELDSWMKQQGKHHGSVRQQSASYRAGRDVEENNSSRSISAPVFGLPGFGQRDDPDCRRKKQLQYAAELKEQIREKKEAQRRERDEIIRDRPSRYQDNIHVKRRGREPDEPMFRHSHHQRNDPNDDNPDDRDMQPSHGYRQPTNYPPDRYRRQYPPPEHDYYPPTGRGYDPHYHPPHYPSYSHYPPPPPPHHHKYYPSSDSYHYGGNPYLPPRRTDWSRGGERSPSPSRAHRREVRIADRHEENGDRSSHKQSSYFGPQATSNKSDKASYQQELHRQIMEKKEREEQDRREKDRYFSKLEEDAKNYNPWGRPGAGAPLRDEKGNIVAGRGLRKSVDGTSPRYVQLTEEEVKKITQEKHAQDLTEQVIINNIILLLQCFHWCICYYIDKGTRATQRTGTNEEATC